MLKTPSGLFEYKNIVSVYYIYIKTNVNQVELVSPLSAHSKACEATCSQL